MSPIGKPEYAWEKKNLGDPNRVDASLTEAGQKAEEEAEVRTVPKTDAEVKAELTADANRPSPEPPTPILTPKAVWTPPTKQTIDPPMGQAPVPEDPAEHVRHGDAQPVIVPQHILDADDTDIVEHLVLDGEQIVAELTGSAMHDRLQNVVVHFRHVLASARDRFLSPPLPVESEPSAIPTSAIKTVALIIMALASLFWIPTGSSAQVVSQVQQQNNAPQATVGAGNAGVLANPSGLNVSVSPGPLYCSGGIGYIHNTQFTLTANTGPWNVFYRCLSDQVAISLDSPVATDIMLGTVTCGATLCNTFVDLRPAFKFPNVSDAVIPFGPGDCAWNATGTLGATTGLNLQAIGASFAPVNSISTTAAGASTDNLTCNIHIPQRTTASKGVMLLDCTIYYGVQTTALTSLGAPTLNTITMPTPGTAETASTVTPVSLGAVTVTPVVGSANLGTTTAGAFFSEKVALNTPVFLNTDLQSIQYNQTFVQSAAAAQIVNTPGGVCHAVTVPL